MELDLRVCKYIVLAQIASDGGKHITEIEDALPIGKVYSKKGYTKKDSLIMKAIKTIQCNKNTGFKFFIKDCDGFSSPAVIVYFNFKLEGKRYQISFHSFNMMLKRLEISNFSTRWDKKSSREAAVVLAEYLNEANAKNRDAE